MVEPLTLSALGVVALTEGIKFLYTQAGEVLKRWRDRKDAAAQGRVPPAGSTEPVEVTLPSIFEGQLSAPQIHFDAVAQLEEQLRALRKDLSEYAEGIETVGPTNQNVLREIDALRQALEAIYRQRLTFKGEQRPPSGPVVEGQIDVKGIAGYAAAVRARVIHSGNVTGRVQGDETKPGSTVIGVETDTVG